MLDSETKRRIDTARDILVGKVPDPKSQVEQITIALIYKFMDDMDAESEELGGERKFFSGEFAKYGWAKLMRSGLGGHETLGLYGEAITRMPENPGIPPLFRDIFKNAYLPYRDPETLRAFLKIIDDFEYDHSERLGDAFEYLLSVLGSQGDAGQFRTPRHIIDFMVSIVDPKKDETVLDPACGTAGFLISSYRHILAANRDASGDSTLTPDERTRLAGNFKGYDISPDMVRLSLVNMYLHGFTDPHIYEYDTLTSQDRWNEYADVILANPPFMSPKGGIKPHNRFSVQSKRSEVLFVDYMAEHLTPTGRAGIIVPEGIIFQSQTAYRRLRKMLVEDCLVAVVSLPAGVFNPYSGVKTSILILDRSLAKRASTVGFFSVENDGFGLGAQRRPIDKDDLPQAVMEVGRYIRGLRTSDASEDPPCALGCVVSKEKIAETGDYSLSGERYRENGTRASDFPMRRFEDVCTLEYGASLPKEKRVDGPYPVVGSNGITGYHDSYSVKGPAIVVGRKGSAGEVTFIEADCFPIDTTYYVRRRDPTESDIRYLYWVLKGLDLPSLRGGAGVPGLNRKDVYAAFEIPLPPLETQEALVVEIEGYQRVADGARAVLESYRFRMPEQPQWPVVELGEAITLQRGYDLPKQAWRDGPYPIVGSNGVIGYHAEYRADGPGVVTGRSGTIGKVHLIAADHFWPHNTSLFVKDFRGNNPKFVKALLETLDLKSLGERTSAVPSLDRKNAHRLQIALPPVSEQEAIVAQIDAEQRLVDANRELAALMDSKIRDAIDRLWILATNEEFGANGG